MNEFIRKNMQPLVQVLSIWNVAIAFASVAILVAVGLNSALSAGIRIVAILVLTGLAACAVIAGIQMMGNRKNARVWALAVNYVGFIICLLGTVQALGVFLIIDELAGTLANGFWTMIALAVVLLLKGWVQGILFGEEDHRPFKIASNVLAGIIALIFVLQVRLIPIVLGVFLNLNSLVSIGLFLGMLLLGFVAWVLNSEPMQERFRTTHQQSEAIAGFLFLTPNLLGFLIFFAFPLLLSLVMSFFEWDVLSPDPPSFIGFGNYVEIFGLSLSRVGDASVPLSSVMDPSRFSELSRFRLFGGWVLLGARDALFWTALGNTLRFALMAVPLSVVLALILSNILNSEIPGMKVFRVLFFIPSIAAIVGVAMIWRWLYHGIIGYINFGLSRVVDFLNLFTANDIVFENINWLSDPDIALFAIAIMAVWQTVGFNTVLFMAGLQGIPKSLYEASTIDGAGPVRRFFRITIPMLAPTTFFVVATSTIQAMQLFEQVYIATSNPEIVNNATLTVVFYLYQNGFERFSQGYASATAWVLFLLIFVVTFFQYRRQRASENLY